LIAETGIEGYLSAVTPEWAAMGMEDSAISAWSAVQRSHNQASLALACAAVADWVIVPNLDALAALAAPVQLIAWEGDTVHPWSWPSEWLPPSFRPASHRACAGAALQRRHDTRPRLQGLPLGALTVCRTGGASAACPSVLADLTPSSGGDMLQLVCTSIQACTLG